MTSWSRCTANVTCNIMQWSEPYLETIFLGKAVQTLRVGAVSASFLNKNCQNSCSKSAYDRDSPLCVAMADIFVNANLLKKCVFSTISWRSHNVNMNSILFSSSIFNFWDSLMPLQTHYTAHAGLELLRLLHPALARWNYKQAPPPSLYQA